MKTTTFKKGLFVTVGIWTAVIVVLWILVRECFIFLGKGG